MTPAVKPLGILVAVCLCSCVSFVGGFGLGTWSGSHDPAEPPPLCVIPTVTTTNTAPTPVVVVRTVAAESSPSLSRVSCSTAVVVTVIDGDTITLDNGETVRYIGIDTPETDECYGPEATEMNRDLVQGKTVILIGDVEDRGKYGRLLRYVIADGRFVNAELVRLGYAKAQSHGDNVMFQQVLTIFERYAYETGAGLWGACEQE